MHPETKLGKRFSGNPTSRTSSGMSLEYAKWDCLLGGLSWKTRLRESWKVGLGECDKEILTKET